MPLKEKEYTITKFREVNYRDIVWGEFKEPLYVNLTVAEEIVSSRIDFTQNREHYMVVDLSNIKQVSPEAKEYLQSAEGGTKNILGAAFIANNPVAGLIANVFVKIPADFEAKYFTNKDEALDWILEIRQKNRGELKS